MHKAGGSVGLAAKASPMHEVGGSVALAANAYRMHKGEISRLSSQGMLYAEGEVSRPSSQRISMHKVRGQYA